MSKRAMDVVLGTIGLVLLSPVLGLIAIAVRINLGRPVLFTQERAGLNGVPFRMYKFRSMVDARASDGSLLPDARRLTPFGRWLRTTSLDELPELWNVLRGDMTLVGPRPLPVAYLPRYSPTEARRHTVRPGITGWAQVNGRNSLGWNERLAADVWYVDNRSLRLDAEILCRTVGSVIGGRDVSAPGEPTMHELPHHHDRIG